MSAEDTTNIAEVVKRGAALISGARETEKAAPVDETEKAAPTEETEKGELPEAFKKKAEGDKKDEDDKDGEDKKEMETEKALEPGNALIVSTPLWEEPAFIAVLERAVEKALAPVLAGLTTVEKSLGTVDSKVDSSLAHQAASTDVLVGLAKGQETLRDTTKSLQAEVEVIGNQPAGRKSVDTRETEKAAPVEEKAQAAIDIDKLREVAKSMDVTDRLTVMKLAKAGEADAVRARLNPKQRAQAGL